MSRQSSKRRIALLAGAAAIMPVAAIGSIPFPDSATASQAFDPPAGPMLLTRTLRRPLPGGAEIRTIRSYEIRFVEDGDGYRIEGELVETSVEAPPSLQALAVLERKRPDIGMFPMRVDAAGRLLPVEETATSEPVMEAARLTKTQIGRIGLSGGEAAQARSFVNRLAGNPGRTPWPVDLFKPVPGKREEVQAMQLDDGQAGEVSIEIEARTEDQSGMLASFARTVTTRLGSDARVTQEIWTLSAKS